jgi:hypothetical protein
VQEQGHVRRLVAADEEAIFPVGGGGSIFSGGVREAGEVERAGGVEEGGGGGVGEGQLGGGVALGVGDEEACLGVGEVELELLLRVGRFSGAATARARITARNMITSCKSEDNRRRSDTSSQRKNPSFYWIDCLIDRRIDGRIYVLD